MKMIRALLTLLCFIAIFDQAKGQIEWTVCLGDTGHEALYDMIELTNGNMVSVGSINIDNRNSVFDTIQDFYVVMFDPLGDTLWSKKYGGSNVESAFFVNQLKDCNLLIGGYSYSKNGIVAKNRGYSDAFIIKIDLYGNVLWSKTYGGSKSEIIKNSFEDSNGDLFIVGYSNSNDGDLSGNNGKMDIWLLKIDSIGTVIWSKLFGGNQEDYGAGLVEINSDTIFLYGTTSSRNGISSSNHGKTDVLLMKLTKQGKMIWSKCIGGSQEDVISNKMMLKKNDTTFYMAISSRSNDFDLSYNHGGFDFGLVKIDSSGKVLKSFNYGGSDDEQVTQLIFSPDNNLYLAGQSKSSNIDISYPNGFWDYWLIKVDTAGKKMLDFSIGNQLSDHGRVLVNSFDFGFIFAGFDWSNYCNKPNFTFGSKDWRISKINATLDSFNDSIVRNFNTFNICKGDSFLFDNRYFKTSGYHYSKLSGLDDCRPRKFVKLVIDSVDNGITRKVGYLKSNAINVDYQWLLCDSTKMTVISGETGKTYSPIATGYYAIAVSDSKCSDTSECLYFDPFLSISEFRDNNQFKIFPNPVENQLTLKLNQNNVKEYDIQIIDLLGTIVYHDHIAIDKQVEIDVSSLKKGIYVFSLISSDTNGRQKIIIE